MKVYGLMFALICLNLAAWSLNISGLFPVSRDLWINPIDITNQFSLVMFAILGVGGTIIGILGAIFRQYTFAAGAILIWVIGIILPIAQWLLGGLPIMMSAFLPTEIAWFSLVVGAFYAIAFFMFILEIAGGRPIT